MESGKNMQRETSRPIVNAKNEYYANLAKKLSGPETGAKPYWSLGLLTRRKFQTYPLCLSMVYLLPMWRSKQTFTMIILFHNSVQ